MKNRVIIIEDNIDLQSGYLTLINDSNKYEVNLVYSSCDDFLNNPPRLKPDIIIMDIDLPGINGIEGTRRIKPLYSKTEIIIISIFENSEKVFEALCAGASGYLSKNSTHDEILEAFDEVLNGGSPMSAKIARMVVNSFHKNTTNSPLTKRESDILELLSMGKSYKSISSNLQISIDTVKFHIKNIYLKLQVFNKEDAIELAKRKKWL